MVTGYIFINRWNNNILFKASEYYKSNKCKNIKANVYGYITHGIKKDDPISLYLTVMKQNYNVILVEHLGKKMNLKQWKY